MTEAAQKKKEEEERKKVPVPEIRSAGVELGRVDEDRMWHIKNVVAKVAYDYKGGEIAKLFGQGKISEAQKLFFEAIEITDLKDLTREEKLGLFKKVKAEVEWEKLAVSIGMHFRAGFEYLSKHPDAMKEFCERVGSTKQGEATPEIIKGIIESGGWKILASLKKVAGALTQTAENQKTSLKGKDAEQFEREKRAILAIVKTEYLGLEKNFEVARIMTEEYSKGNYDAVLALSTAASKSMDSAYNLATSPAMLLIAARMIQERQKVYENIFGGLTLVFAGISSGPKEKKVGAGEPAKEEGKTETKEEAQARAEVQAAAITEMVITQAIVELPQIAQEQGIVAESIAPEIIVETGKEEKKPRGPPPEFRGGTIVAKTGKTAKAVAPIEVTAAEARQEEPRAAGFRVAPILSREEQKVYAAAMERVQELIGEEVAKVGEEEKKGIRKRA